MSLSTPFRSVPRRFPSVSSARLGSTTCHPVICNNISISMHPIEYHTSHSVRDPHASSACMDLKWTHGACMGMYTHAPCMGMYTHAPCMGMYAHAPCRCIYICAESLVRPGGLCCTYGLAWLRSDKHGCMAVCRTRRTPCRWSSTLRLLSVTGKWPAGYVWLKGGRSATGWSVGGMGGLVGRTDSLF